MVLLTLAIGGCGWRAGDQCERHPVRGTVSLDGAPLANGSIIFYPEQEGAIVSGAVIQDGQFEIPAAQGLPIGSYKVSVTATEEAVDTTELDPDELMENPPSAVSLIPPQYNTETTLIFEVYATPENVLDLELTAE